MHETFNLLALKNPGNSYLKPFWLVTLMIHLISHEPAIMTIEAKKVGNSELEPKYVVGPI